MPTSHVPSARFFIYRVVLLHYLSFNSLRLGSILTSSIITLYFLRNNFSLFNFNQIWANGNSNSGRVRYDIQGGRFHVKSVLGIPILFSSGYTNIIFHKNPWITHKNILWVIHVIKLFAHKLQLAKQYPTYIRDN